MSTYNYEAGPREEDFDPTLKREEEEEEEEKNRNKRTR